MSLTVFILLAVNLLLIGLLPRIFFRRDGHLNLRWWLTALPFFVAALMLLTHQAQLLPAVVDIPPILQNVNEIAIVLMALLSNALLVYTLGTHTHPIALWHQDNDQPQHIVTHGAYKHIRHPFYSSFLLTLAAFVLAVPQLMSLLIALYAFWILNKTAAREEQRLAQSDFGKQYRSYMAHTGRFFPSLNGVRHA